VVTGASGHYENFPVASVLLPAGMRPHVAAVYAFARAADDFADEGTLSPDERLRLLDGWERRLLAAAHGESHTWKAAGGEPPDSAAIFTRLAETIRKKQLPVELFQDLLSAFRQDVTVRRYQSWPHLLHYCRRSANPVGRLVLRIAGQRSAQFDSWSDCICTALQLTNLWQDLAIDWDRGRLYVPLDLAAAHGATERDLSAASITDAWRTVLSIAANHTRDLFRQGRPLCDAVRGRLKYELRATWLGGMRILDTLEACRFDVWSHRPVLRAADAPWFAFRMATWSSGRH
jgi:phytoene synthase